RNGDRRWEGEEGGGGPEGRRALEEAGVPVREGGPVVPRGQDRPVPQEGPLCPARRHRSSGLRRCRARVSRRQGIGVGWKCGKRQQEEQDNTKACPVGYEE
ncbi:hypothetical protein RJ640_011943, partial [Escallonia rubra]